MINQDLVVDKLGSARQLVAAYFDKPSCAWEGRFHVEQRECRDCADAAVCSWIFTQDPTPDLSRYSNEKLVDALMFATGFLEGQMFSSGHDPETCSCEICIWVREVHALTNES